MRRSARSIMIVADALVPNWHQSVCNHHTDPTPSRGDNALWNIINLWFGPLVVDSNPNSDRQFDIVICISSTPTWKNELSIIPSTVPLVWIIYACSLGTIRALLKPPAVPPTSRPGSPRTTYGGRTAYMLLNSRWISKVGVRTGSTWLAFIC